MSRIRFGRSVLVAVCGVLLALAAAAQSTFVTAQSQIPSGNPFNTGYTENVDFADVDGDGDFDIAKAEGGDFGNQQNRLWINRGFEAGGTIGFFADRTAAQFPALVDDSRDVEFADIDGDGDVDLHVVDTSAIVNQPCRWWINMGGAQSGTQGFFQDQTAARWVGLGGAGSSMPPSQALMNGGFVDFSNDSDFADLDGDGDLDLAHATVGVAFNGNAPTRLFLNDAGYFSEFNPSGFQLASSSIVNGNPALWAMGTQLHSTTNTSGATSDIAAVANGIELGDIDGDLDADLLLGDRNDKPRMFRNRLVQNGGVLVAFQDVSAAVFPAGYAPGSGAYEQELGDCDGDDDLDLYGVNWQQVSSQFTDVVYANDGTGVFGSPFVVPGSAPDDQGADYLDYDNDGDLDVYAAAFSGQDRLYRNDFAGAGLLFTNVTSTEMPALSDTSLDAEAYDLDDDGDADVLVAKDADDPERLLKNIRDNADAFAPRLPRLEQAPDRTASTTPTAVRVQQYDNQAYYGTWYNATELLYRVVPGAFVSAPMTNSGGTNLFRGEIPGTLIGTVEYFARATDNHGNVGVSATKSYVASCASGAVSYCTAGTSSSGCAPVLSATGTPSASATSGFTVVLNAMEGQKQGLFFYGIHGRKAVQWGAGSTSFVCLAGATQRTPTQNSGGTSGACDGTFTLDWNDYRNTHPTSLGQAFSAGDVVNLQAWYRDPPAAKTTNLSAAIEFVVCP
jgi:hypothetical protein